MLQLQIFDNLNFPQHWFILSINSTIFTEVYLYLVYIYI